mgnify:CR=1 FL=1|jgi:hypothetical protein
MRAPSTSVCVVNIGGEHLPDPIRRSNLLIEVRKKVQVRFVAGRFTEVHLQNGRTVLD